MLYLNTVVFIPMTLQNLSNVYASISPAKKFSTTTVENTAKISPDLIIILPSLDMTSPPTAFLIEKPSPELYSVLRHLNASGLTDFLKSEISNTTQPDT